MVLESRTETPLSEPIARLLALLIAVVVLAGVLSRVPFFRDLPPIWSVSNPPDHLRFCGRDYREPHRRSDPIEPADPVIERVEGQPLRYPEKQTVTIAAGEVCTTVLQIHDSRGWVTYSLVGGP